MKRIRFTEEQIIAILREHEAGAKTGDLARRHGVSEATLYNWKAKYGGMDVPEAKRLEAARGGEREAEEASSRTDAGCSGSSRASLKMYGPPRPCKGRDHFDDPVCINVSGLSRVSRCCGAAAEMFRPRACQVTSSSREASERELLARKLCKELLITV